MKVRIKKSQIKQAVRSVMRQARGRPATIGQKKAMDMLGIRYPADITLQAAVDVIRKGKRRARSEGDFKKGGKGPGYSMPQKQEKVEQGIMPRQQDIPYLGQPQRMKGPKGFDWQKQSWVSTYSFRDPFKGGKPTKFFKLRWVIANKGPMTKLQALKVIGQPMPKGRRKGGYLSSMFAALKQAGLTARNDSQGKYLQKGPRYDQYMKKAMDQYHGGVA